MKPPTEGSVMTDHCRLTISGTEMADLIRLSDRCHPISTSIPGGAVRLAGKDTRAALAGPDGWIVLAVAKWRGHRLNPALTAAAEAVVNGDRNATMCPQGRASAAHAAYLANPPEQPVMIAMPGKADTRLRDGDFPREHAETWALYIVGERQNRGRGYTRRSALTPTQWREIRRYLDGVAGANAAAIASDGYDAVTRRSVRDEMVACSTAVARIDDALDRMNG